MPEILIQTPDGRSSTVRLEAGQSLSIGRSSKNNLVLADLSLSRFHAVLKSGPSGWTVEDQGSRNGTFVNGRRLTGPLVIHPGDRISLGETSIQFEPGSSAAPRVVFSNQPVAREGTVIMPLKDAMTMPDSTPGITGRVAMAPDDMEARLRRLQVIEKANLELLGHEPLDVLIPKVLDLVARAVRPERVLLFLSEPSGELVCRAGRGAENVSEMQISRTITRTVMEERVSILTSDAQSDARFRDGDSIVLQGIHSVMAVPLWTNREAIGLIYADSRLATGLFREDDLRVLTILANIAAIQIDNARLFEERLQAQRLDQEARAAAEIQRRLLPSGPFALPGYAVEAFNLPCFEVGGDYYDVVSIDGGREAIILADVAGKGMGAAMIMAGLQASFRAQAALRPEPDDLLPVLNEAIKRTTPANRFVTLFYLVLDRQSHRLRYVNAGHAPSPIVLRASGAIERLSPGGVPLGILPSPRYPVKEVALEPGDFVFLCSDGVTDTGDPEGRQYGEETLERLLVTLAGRPPAEVRHVLEEALEAHAAGTPPPDDLTLVILQRQT